jgi:two-component system, NarL family, response regulator YdfI
LTRLLIAAASPVLRAGLESLAAGAPHLQVVGVYPDLSEAAELRPDVALAALDPGALAPAPAIVLLTGRPEAAWTRQALRTGVRAILPENADPSEILAAIDAAAAGLAVIDPDELEMLLGPGGQHAPSPQPLTPRELEVLRLLAEGDANKSIAWKLGLSEHTVKFHVASLMAKLDAGSRTEAVTIGIRQGLVLI